MKGSDDAGLHFSRRLIGEGHGENAPKIKREAPFIVQGQTKVFADQGKGLTTSGAGLIDYKTFQSGENKKRLQNCSLFL